MAQGGEVPEFCVVAQGAQHALQLSTSETAAVGAVRPDFRGLHGFALDCQGKGGEGVVVCKRRIPGGEDAVSSMLFCPSANPREVSRQPGHAHQALNAGFNTAASASCTYVGHFCTLTGKRLGINRPRGESPMLLADIVFDDNNPSGSPQQAHEGKTFSASMWDGSAKTHEFEQVQHVNLLIPRFSNRRHAGNIWHWAAKARR